MDDKNREKLKRIAQYSQEDIGNAEENIKNKFIVKLLECLDYSEQDMDFESGRTDIFLKNLPPDCKVIIETKSYSSNLSNYQFISQLEDYCRRFAALIGVLANGTELRIYTPYMMGKKFEESMLCIIKRNELIKDDKIKLLEKYLHKENLTSKKIKESIREREEQLDSYKADIDALTREIDQKILANNQIIEERRNENEKLETQKISKVQEIEEDIGVPQITSYEVDKSHFQKPRANMHEAALKAWGTRNKAIEHILDVVELITKHNKHYTEAFRIVAQKKQIEESTIRASCTRTLGLNTDQFNDLIIKKEITDFLKKRFPSKIEEIEHTLVH